ncbi:hybrid sensor histidine kinase/response regulator [Candidatus Methylocalor cossyra]|uniref:histidine kinase n=1 Tax=Candidatus Methylocalor cossyra TaxID=3108543 RepID=A0ABM9NGV4_9GAMM
MIPKFFLNRYLVAVLSTGVALLILKALDPVFGAAPPLTLLLASVAVSAAFGGFRAGFLATLLSVLASLYLLLEPTDGLRFERAENRLQVVLLGGLGGLLSVLFWDLKQAKRRALATAQERERRLQLELAEREQVELSLREQRRFTDKLFHSALNGIYVFDIKVAAPIFINRQYTRLTGYTLEDFRRLRGEAFWALVHPEDRERWFEHMNRLATQGDEEPVEVEYRFKHAQGDWRWYLARHTVFSRDADGQPWEILGACFDITERKYRELDTGYQRALMETLQMAAPVGLGFLDRDLRYVRVNETLAAIDGLPADQHLGRSGAEVIPELWPQLEPVYRQVLATGQPAINVEVSGETRAQPAVLRHFRGDYYPVRIGDRVAGIGVVIQEITERKRAEAKIQRLNEQLAQRVAELQALFDLTPIGLIISEDPECRFIRMNATLARLFGVRPDINASLSAPPGERPPWKVLLKGVEAQPEELPMRKAAALGRPVTESDYRVVLEDGRTFRFTAHTAPLRDAQGRVRGVIGALVDMTQHLQLEEKLQQQAAQLDAANRRKDEFLATLAHELRNPLAPIRNAVHVLRRLPLEDRTVLWAQNMIGRQVEYLARLVDDLLDVSRITRGKIRLDRQPVAVATLLERAAEAVTPAIENRRQRLQVTAPPSEVRVLGDAIRLVQVLTNLLDNAAKYSPEGAPIWLSADAVGDWVAVRVRDQGMGIPAALLPEIFEVFAQGERSLDRAQGGLGIGLALVRHLVEMHDGRVEVFSAGEGQGSEFTVWLPRYRAGAPALAAEPAAEAPTTRPVRVLVVDDNQDSADSIGALLRLSGHTVVTVYDGAAALRTARTFRPEVVLLDIGLPDLDGYEVARRLRTESGAPGPLLVAVTGYGGPQDLAHSDAAGFARHLVKPVDEAVLEEVLRAAPEIPLAEGADPEGGDKDLFRRAVGDAANEGP